MKVVLHADTEVLDEVVVTAYGTATKGTFTGSASVMKADKIEKRQVSNITNALAGAVAGVQIQRRCVSVVSALSMQVQTRCM